MKKIEKAALFGLGKAGSALFISLQKADIFVGPLGSRSQKTRHNFRQVHKGQKLFSDLNDWFDEGIRQKVDVFFLAISDDQLGDKIAQLDLRAPPSTRLIHLSAAKGLGVFEGCVNIKGSVFHPLSSLSASRPIPQGSFVGIMSSDAAPLLSLAKSAGLDAARIKDAADYHAGAVMGANLPLALLELGIDALMRAGLPKERARKALALLMGSAAERAFEQPIDKALTGPLARGDADVVAKHLSILNGLEAELYRQLSQLLLNSASHNSENHQALSRVLSKKG